MNRRDVHNELKAWILSSTDTPLPLNLIDLDLVDDAGFTAMHILAEMEEANDFESFHFEQKAHILIRFGAPIHSGEFFLNYTPLQWCSWHPAPGACMALIAAGAQTHAINRNGDNALTLCKKQFATTHSAGLHRRTEKLQAVFSILASQTDKIALEKFIPDLARPEPSEPTRL